MHIVLIFAIVLVAIKSSQAAFTKSIRIPSDGETCNVININIGGEFANKSQGPAVTNFQDEKEDDASEVNKIKKEKNSKWEKAQSNARIKLEILQMLAVTSCDDLRKNHGILVSGYYLMRKENSSFPEYVYCNFQAFQVPTDCRSVHLYGEKKSNFTDGVFDIYPNGAAEQSTEVYCDLTTDGGGWTVFQRRLDGSTDFYRNWTEYVRGFGEKDKEMWLGLETIHQLTKNGRYELRIDMTDWEGNSIYAKYRKFAVAPAADNYTLTAKGYSGDAGDSMSDHHGMQFTTKDVDNDRYSFQCAEYHHGAWWYRTCAYANLNGLYYQGGVYHGDHHGIFWVKWKDSWTYSMKFTEMKFRKVN